MRRRFTGLLAILFVAGLLLPGCGGSSASGGNGAGRPLPEKIQKNEDIMRSAAKAVAKKTSRHR
jgi:hypothetical protein